MFFAKQLRALTRFSVATFYMQRKMLFFSRTFNLIISKKQSWAHRGAVFAMVQVHSAFNCVFISWTYLISDKWDVFNFQKPVPPARVREQSYIQSNHRNNIYIGDIT